MLNHVQVGHAQISWRKFSRMAFKIREDFLPRTFPAIWYIDIYKIQSWFQPLLAMALGKVHRIYPKSETLMCMGEHDRIHSYIITVDKHHLLIHSTYDNPL